MQERETALLEAAFKRYYFDHFEMIRVPDRPASREFGYQKFNSGMARHIAIKDDRQLRLLIMQNIPSDIYCSNGYYLFPDLPMAEKDWQEADLIFDIDAKDLALPCRTNHTFKKCIPCGKVYAGQPACPACGSAKHSAGSVACMDCIGGAKREVEKLAQILTDDLGIDAGSMRVYFSGNEGFHVYAYGSQFQGLGSKERSDLADYIMFKGAIPETFGMRRQNTKRGAFPDSGEGGWRGRVSRELLGPKSKRSKMITQAIKEGYPSFMARLQEASPKIGANIDPNVTGDIHRIFRLPGSLNSKSGLAKTPCEDLEAFDPYKDACFISGEETSVIAEVPCKFSLGGTKFGPYAGEQVSVPLFAAVYMICKGLAALA